MRTGTALSNTPTDILSYQNELIRTGKALPLGIAKMISIGPHKDCPPLDSWDPIMKKYGRLIQLRNMALPIAQSPDRSMILATAPLVDRDGRVRLPDLPDPTWVPMSFTPEEATGQAKRASDADTPRMLEQSLRTRAEGFLEGSNFYVFSPVLSISFQPEKDGHMLGTFWAVECKPNPADGTYPALLVDAKTGETHFFGGLYHIVRATGEN